MKKANKVLVKANDYNGHKDVLFMMQADDFRLTNMTFKNNYTVLAQGKYSKRILKTELGDFNVFSDWSVKKV